MTWLSRICSSLALTGLAALSAHAERVTGSVVLVDSSHPDVRARRDYSGVVVWLEPDGPSAPAAGKTAKMVQKGKKFTPHVLAIQVGTTVEFPNLDPIFHNAFSNFSGQPFDVGLYPPGTSEKVTFRRDGVARVFCNIHPTMSAVIVALKTPYFGVTSSSGAFGIAGVPPGEYTLRVFHERSTDAQLKSLSRRVTIGAGDYDLPSIRISESGHIQTPHKNKYGKEYPPVPEGPAGYSGRSQ